MCGWKSGWRLLKSIFSHAIKSKLRSRGLVIHHGRGEGCKRVAQQRKLSCTFFSACAGETIVASLGVCECMFCGCSLTFKD